MAVGGQLCRCEGGRSKEFVNKWNRQSISTHDFAFDGYLDMQ